MTPADKGSWITDDAYATYVSWMGSVDSSADLNEDTTRMRLIDTILFNHLRWDRNFVDTEPYLQNIGYADYIFTTKSGRTLVLEAKKSGSTFSLQSSAPYPGRGVPFSLIADKCPEAHKAMQQAVNYANSNGARYTAISNGHQWLLMLTAVEGLLLKERNVIVFESLEAIRDRFPLFWDCFAPLSLQVNKPHGLLLDVRRQPPPAKLAKTIPNYPVQREDADIRNQHATGLQYLWDEITNSEGTETFFEKCYVPPAGHEKNRSLAIELLSDRAADDAATYERSDAADLAVDVDGFLKEVARPERPVVLLGRIGHGKSTFIKFLKTIAAPAQLSNYIQIDVDFLDLPRTKEEVARYVYRNVEQQLRDRYNIDIADDAIVRAALNIQLKGFRKTPRAKMYLDDGDSERFNEAELSFIESWLADSHTYLQAVFQHLRAGRKKSIAVFLDNLDKRDELQEEAFLVASSIARDWSAIVFICLRPGTFQRSRDVGVLDSIAPRLIHVYSPPTNLFLRRRFDYGAEIAAGDVPAPRGREALSKAIASEGRDLCDLLGALSNSIRRDKSLAELFEAVANGNLRDVLYRAGTVITSWHLNTTEMIRGVRESGTYNVTHHQAIRAMLYGTSLHFDPKTSPLINLFDIEHADPVEHFLRPTCLFHLAPSGSEPGRPGFLSYEEIAGRVSRYTFTPDVIDGALQSLFEKRLIEDDQFSTEWPGTMARLRLTALGRYHISDLLGRFQYLDAVVIDTPVLDASITRQITVVQDIRDRVARCRSFLRYLNTCAQHVSNTPIFSHWERVHEHVANEITDIEEANATW